MIRTSKGFTLLELSLVAVIIGLIASSSVYMLVSRVQRAGIESAQMQVSSHLRLAREEATRTRRFYMLDFSNFSNAYLVRTCRRGCFGGDGAPILSSGRWQTINNFVRTERSDQIIERSGNATVEDAMIFLPQHIVFSDSTEYYVIFEPKGTVKIDNLRNGFPARIQLQHKSNRYTADIEVSIGGFVKNKEITRLQTQE
ncbi:MAG: type II secretion system protein [Gemmatimonadetes bacterium]|nr:MAG: type II secretion system protein [Gemmatimonadota bacterium]